MVTKPLTPIIALVSILAVFGISFDKVVTQGQFNAYKQETAFKINSIDKRLTEIEKFNLMDLEREVDKMGCELLLSMLHEKRSDKERLVSLIETNMMGRNVNDALSYQQYIEGQIINLGSEIRLLELKIQKNGC